VIAERAGASPTIEADADFSTLPLIVFTWCLHCYKRQELKVQNWGADRRGVTNYRGDRRLILARIFFELRFFWKFVISRWALGIK
jgi:hypothetical protein